MKRKKARPIDRLGLKREDLLLRRQSVRLVAQEIDGTDQPSKRTLNSVSHRIADAVAKNHLAFAAPDQFRFGDLVRWAQDTWPGKFLGWPVIRTGVVTPAVGTSRIALLQAMGVGRVLPADTVDGWRNYAERVDAEYSKLSKAHQSLRLQFDELSRENAGLRAFKLQIERKAAETQEKKRKAGQKGGRGRPIREI